MANDIKESVVATNENIHKLVNDAIEKNGVDCDLNYSGSTFNVINTKLSCIFDKITPDEHSDTFRVQAHLQSDDNPLAKLSFTCKCHDGKQ